MQQDVAFLHRGVCSIAGWCRLQWMIGGYYSDETIDQEVNFRLGDDYDGLVGALFGGAFGPAPLQLLTTAMFSPDL